MTSGNPASTDHPAITTAPEKLPRMSHPHVTKFRIALAALIGIAVGAVAVAIAVGTNQSSRTTTVTGAKWSSWSPDTSGSAGTTEIADHIAPYYRISASKQLNVITPISVSEATAAGTTTGNGLTV